MREAHIQYLDEAEISLTQMIEKLQSHEEPKSIKSSTVVSTIGNGHLNSTQMLAVNSNPLLNETGLL
jgi:hypothetical protein